MRRLEYLLLFFIFFSINAYSQGGSAYSFFGIGDILHDYSIKRSGMGGLANSSNDYFDLNSYNPAAWSTIRNIYISASLRYDLVKTSDFSQKNDFNNYLFQSVGIAVPVSNELGITATLGVSPFSRVNYNIMNENSYEQTPYKVNYMGSGGLNKFNLGTSFKAPFSGSLGINLNYFTGTINYESKIDVNNEGTFYNSFVREKVLNGFGFTLGYISGNLNDFLKVDFLNSFKLSFVYNSVSKLYTEENVLKSTFVLDTVSSASYYTEIPFSFGIGAGFTFDKRYNVFLDYFQQNWADYKVDGKKDNQLNKSFIFSGGFEMIPEAKPEYFFATFTYRLGAFFKQSEFLVKDTKINEFGITGGVTIPFDARNAIDFALQYSIRGTQDNSLQKDKMVKLLIGISFSDIWFLREED